MELGGLEPPTSWVRCARSARLFRIERCQLAGDLCVSECAEVGADAGGSLAIIHDSGTPGDECLNATHEHLTDVRGRQAPASRRQLLGRAAFTGEHATDFFSVVLSITLDLADWYACFRHRSRSKPRILADCWWSSNPGVSEGPAWTLAR